MGCNCTGDRSSDGKTDIAEPLYIEIVNKQILENDVLLYTLSDCEKSRTAKTLIRKQGLDFEYFDLDKLSDDQKILHTLQKMTNYKSPPYIFIKGVYKGDLKELEKIVAEGKIKEYLI